jgi:Apea-like HEPN
LDALTSYRSTPSFRPNLALLIAQDEEIFVEPGAASAPALISAAEKTTRAVRALTLASGYPFVQSWQSSWLDHLAVPYEGFGGIGGTGTFDGPPQRRGDATPVDPKVAEEMFSKLKSLGSAVKIPVELATDRLRRSRTHQSPADIALDLGIASEVILLHDIEGTSEFRYRLSFRGAYLLAGDPVERHKKFESFRSLYDARSQAAHKGTLNEDFHARLPEFDEICTAAIRAIVDRQRFPNWNELTLGSRSS